MEPKIKVSELFFFSCQGEGQYIGVPSIFLRTYGCNFTCGGFGMPRGQKSTERDKIAENINQYDDYKQLPLVSTGCDSYASWDPRFKDLSPLLTIDAIVAKIIDLLPNKKFSKDVHLIITGGEPLLGWQKSYPELLDILINNYNLTHLTFETNATQLLRDELYTYLKESGTPNNTGRIRLETTFSMSVKLPCSGEKPENAWRPDIISKYISIPNNRSYFKFVVATAQDIDDVKLALDKLKDAWKSKEIDIPVYLMPVGGTNSVYEMNERNVADYCRDNGYRFSPRIQVPLYKNAWGT